MGLSSHIYVRGISLMSYFECTLPCTSYNCPVLDAFGNSVLNFVLIIFLAWTFFITIFPYSTLCLIIGVLVGFIELPFCCWCIPQCNQVGLHFLAECEFGYGEYQPNLIWRVRQHAHECSIL